jgi:hypothetical protein
VKFNCYVSTAMAQGSMQPYMHEPEFNPEINEEDNEPVQNPRDMQDITQL